MRVLRKQESTLAHREFEKLYTESFSLVYNYVCYRMADDAEAEDVVAEAYLKAARYFDRFDPARSKFSTWVISIAMNCMRSHFRKTRPTSVLDDVPEKVLAVEGEQDAVDDRELVLQLLKCLDPSERDLVAMKYHEGMRNVDIAEKLGMNPSTVSTKLANAIAKMRAAATQGR